MEKKSCISTSQYIQVVVVVVVVGGDLPPFSSKARRSIKPMQTLVIKKPPMYIIMWLLYTTYPSHSTHHQAQTKLLWHPPPPSQKPLSPLDLDLQVCRLWSSKVYLLLVLLLNGIARSCGSRLRKDQFAVPESQQWC